jgi:hypothetical protein
MADKLNEDVVAVEITTDPTDVTIEVPKPESAVGNNPS